MDPTTDSKTEAGYRAAYLMENIDYRLGSLSGEYVGIPEITAGRFITLKNFGKPVNNNFYLTNVRHIMDGVSYVTKFEGCANTIGN